MLYSVRVGSRQAVPNKLIWFSDAVLLFVVEWRQNEPFTPYADKNLKSQYSTGNDELCKLYDWPMANKLSQGFKLDVALAKCQRATKNKYEFGT